MTPQELADLSRVMSANTNDRKGVKSDNRTGLDARAAHLSITRQALPRKWIAGLQS